MDRMTVYLLHHVDHSKEHAPQDPPMDDNGVLDWDGAEGDDVKLLGVYSSKSAALSRISQARMLPGFREEPECFTVSPHKIDEDHWREGFVKIYYDESTEDTL